MARWGVAIGRVSLAAVLVTLVPHAATADPALHGVGEASVRALGDIVRRSSSIDAVQRIDVVQRETEVSAGPRDDAAAISRRGDALDPSTPQVVPGHLPVALFLALEAATVVAWVLAFARRRPADADGLRLCSRCARLHAWAGAVGRGADAVAVGALMFLVALPFVAAGYESGFTVPNVLLAASAVAAVVAAAAEVYFLARIAAARLSPNFRWSAEPARIVGGGARWLGAVLVLYLAERSDAGLVAFGPVGERVVRDLGSTGIIATAAGILAAAWIVALAARWLVPLLFGSLPTALAPQRESHGRAR